MNTRGRACLWAFVSIVALGCASARPSPDALDTPFAPAGDPARGRELFVSRDGGHCVLCHAAPGVAAHGDVGPALAGIGARLTAAQIRLRVADITRVKPQAAMPTFHGDAPLRRVAPEYRGRPALSGQQVEDLVAWLASLR